MKLRRGFALIELLLGSSLLCVVILGCAYAWRQIDTAQHQIYFKQFSEQSAQDLLVLIASNPTQKRLYLGHYTQPFISSDDCENNLCTASQKASWDKMLWTQHLFLSPILASSKQVAHFEPFNNDLVACVNLNGHEIDVVIAWRSEEHEPSCHGNPQHQVKLTQTF